MANWHALRLGDKGLGAKASETKSLSWPSQFGLSSPLDNEADHQPPPPPHGVQVLERYAAYSKVVASTVASICAICDTSKDRI